MNHPETAALLHHVAELDSRIQRLVATEQQAAESIRRWASALKYVPAVAGKYRWDVVGAVSAYYGRRDGDRSAQFRPIEPADILAAWSQVARNVLSRHTDPLPAADADDTATYLAELAAYRAAVIGGHSAPSGVRELMGSNRAGGVSEISVVRRTAARIRGELAQRRAGQGRGDAARSSRNYAA
ncbi:hypothetical protein ACIBL5_01855 [Streptomyces sp. NPDC050516]|uniref:hypothetical protein n=1 Tax=Streptomyces sp. NPDC050516 TaxID=3365621 RepID=UPI0037A5A496